MTEILMTFSISDKKILLLIIFATLARLIIAGSLELGNDEVYYWTYALHLQWNYFDHPPIVGWLIRLTTANLLLHTELFVRFGAIISSAMGTFLIYRTGTVARNKQTGWYAALLYTASPYCSIIAGTFILPDSPQMVFWLWSIFLLIRIVKLPLISSSSPKLWCWFGVSAGLCVMCKVHGVFLWFAVVLYALFYNRSWFNDKSIYLSVVISLLIVSPVIAWNIQNHFISYAYHSNRVTLSGAALNLDGFAKELAGSFFYNNPLNFVLIWSSIITFWKGKVTTDKSQIRLLLCCGLPLIGVLLIVSLFKDTLPHWSGPGYSCLIILAAIRLSSVFGNKISRVHTYLKYSLAFTAVLSIAGIIVINCFPGTLSSKKSGLNTGEGDFTLDMYGWKETGIKIDSVFKSDSIKKTMPGNAPIIINNWFPAAHIDFYIASITSHETYALGNLFNLHQYFWYNQYKKPLRNGDAAYFIMPSNLYKPEDIEQLKQNFLSISPPDVICIYRQRVLCKRIYIFRLKGYRSNARNIRDLNHDL